MSDIYAFGYAGFEYAVRANPAASFSVLDGKTGEVDEHASVVLAACVFPEPERRSPASIAAELLDEMEALREHTRRRRCLHDTAASHKPYRPCTSYE